MTATIAQSALDAIEHSGPADWAMWLAQFVMTAGATAVTLVCAWHAGTAVGEWLGRRGA